jgi:hypothetical protein
MDDIPFWVFLFPCVIAVLSWAWLLLARFKRWPAPNPPPEAAPSADDAAAAAQIETAWYRRILDD